VITRTGTRGFVVVGILVALLIAGVGSYYASSNPDGLEFVADKTGFIDSAEDSKTADSPLAGYDTKGVDNDRLGGGIAGVAGVLIVLVLMSGVAFAVRRRSSTEADD
jgi:cobalt/nickel transport protein